MKIKNYFYSFFLTQLLFVVGCASHIPPASKAGARPTSEIILQDLRQGNDRFVSGDIRRDGQSKQDIERLSSGQSPGAIVLSCSDSRVPPELVFDQKLGEIFAVRSAGEALSPVAIASIEFAIAKLGSQLIVVLGHTDCGAVKAAHETLSGKKAATSNLQKLVDDIHPRIRQFASVKPSQNFEHEAWANIEGIVKDLSRRSQVIAEALKSKKVKIVPALYHLSGGKVEFR